MSRSSIEDAPSAEASPSSPEPPSPSEAFDLTSHLHDLMNRRAANHDRPAVTLQRSLPDTVVPVTIDPDEVAEVVDALLDNALDNTEEGSVTLRLTADRETAEIEVVDTGTGAEERFMQVYTRTTPSEHTLNSIHQKADQLGMAMQMDDAETGTRFRLTVPCASASRPSSTGE